MMSRSCWNFTPCRPADALREHWLRTLPDGQRRILEILANATRIRFSARRSNEATGLARSSATETPVSGGRKLITVSKEGPRASNELFG